MPRPAGCWYMERGGQHKSEILQRHLKPSINFKAKPQVMSLLGLYESGVGPVLAEELIRHFDTVAKIATLSPTIIAETVPGMGERAARMLLKSLGVEYE